MMPGGSWPVPDMNAWNGTALPLSRCATMATHDIDAVHAHMSAMFCRHDLHIEGGLPPIAFR